MTSGNTPLPSAKRHAPPAAQTVSAGLARGLIELASARGASAERLAEDSGIALAALADQDARVPYANYVRLMRAAKQHTGQPALALHYGEEVDASAFSIVGLLVQASETIGHALAELNRFVGLVIEVEGETPGERFRLVREGTALWLEDTRLSPNDFPELTEAAFARIVAGAHRLGASPFVTAVEVTHPEPAYRAEYERIFSAPVRFGAARNALCLNEPLLARPVAQTPRYVFGLFSERAQALLESLRQPKTVRAQVEGHLLPILHTGRVGIDDTARALGMSRQTLFRKLKAEGVTFEQVLDTLRHRLAVHYLDSRKVSVNETAYLVGFSDPAAFSRAFKRWTGRSPAHFKAASLR